MSDAAGEAAEGPILEDLATAGYRVLTLADLRHSGVRYHDAIPVLLEWLAKTTDFKTKEEIVRALSVPWAKPSATEPLIFQFRQVDDQDDPTGLGLRWTIGNALEVLFADAFFDEFAKLANDRRYGRARQMVVLGIGKSKQLAAVDVLLGLIEDPDVDGHAVKALGKLKTSIARPALEMKLADKRAWVRAEARSALAKLSTSSPSNNEKAPGSESDS